MANDSEKTSRIAYLCWTLIVLSLLFFMSQSNACNSFGTFMLKSCNNEGSCKDEFYEIKDGYSSHACTPGARVEVVSSPPAPKPGIMCHCVNSDAGSSTVSPTP